MRKFFRVTWAILSYVLIYLGLQIKVASLAVIPFTIFYFKDPTALSQAVLKYVFIITTIAAIIAFLFYVLIFRYKEENLFQRCKFVKFKFTSSIYVILTAIGLSSLSCCFVALYGDKFKSYNDVSENIAVGSHSILTLLCIIIFVPIFEEILFRGLVFNELKKNTNIIVSIILQALIFGTFHLNLLQGIYTAFLAIALALIYTWTKSIWAPILLHMCFNFLGTSIMPNLLSKAPQYIYWYGGIGFVMVVIFMFAIFINEKNKHYIALPII